MLTSLVSAGSLLRVRSSAVALAVTVACSARLMAQQPVGHPLDRTPYEDVKLGQTLTVSAGWMGMGRDVAGVAAKPGPLAQVRYDAAVGGPGILFARYTVAPSTRDVINPGLPRATRIVRSASVVTHMLDVGLDLALTGQKTWHHFIPSVVGGVGMISDFAKADDWAYRFGAKFTMNYGLGLRYLAPGGMRLHADVTHVLLQYDYPNTYLVKASDSTAVVSNASKTTAWRGNLVVTAGVSIPIFR